MSLNKLNSIASNKSSKRVGRGSASGSGKLLGEDIKDKRLDLEVELDLGSKEGKCQFNKGCPNSDLPLRRQI